MDEEAVDATLAGIDAVLEGASRDCTVGVDAMRWTPPEEREERTPVLGRSTGPHLRFGVARASIRPVDSDGPWVEIGTISEPSPGAHRFAALQQAVILHPDDAAALRRGFENAGKRAAEGMRQIRVVAATALRDWERLRDAARPLVKVADEEQDPRERALQARKNRNTGPARDPFARRGR